MKNNQFPFLIILMLFFQQIQAGGLQSKPQSDDDTEQLILAVREEKKELFMSLLSKQRGNINVRERNGNKSLLHILIENHVVSDCDTSNCFHTTAFRDLVNAGADVNALAEQTRFLYFFFEWLDITPLHLAAQHCLPEFVAMLLDHKNIEVRGQAFKLANIDTGSGTCFSPLQLAQQQENSDRKQRTIVLLETYEKDHPGKPKYYSAIPNYYPSLYDFS